MVMAIPAIKASREIYSPIFLSILYICALKIAASVWYKVEPSKLKEYPVGIMNEALCFCTPIPSTFAIRRGRTASELAVEKSKSNSPLSNLNAVANQLRYHP